MSFHHIVYAIPVVDPDYVYRQLLVTFSDDVLDGVHRFEKALHPYYRRNLMCHPLAE